MLDIRARFITFYYNYLRQTEMFKAMDSTFENSPWHRESSVLIHTDMVVSNYLAIAQSDGTAWLIGALANAFHDVGKPAAEEIVHSEERGTYRRYAGHEPISARMWENWAVENWLLLRSYFPELISRSIFQVGWIIQYHLPFSLKDKTKVSRLIATAELLVGRVVFANCLEADCRGRISDNHDDKLANTREWIDMFLKADNTWTPKDSEKVCYVLIGASGSGKSTFTSQRLAVRAVETGRPFVIHSMDALRHEWYGDDYSEAYRLSTEDKTFKSRVQQHFMDLIKNGGDVVVDNTNVSTKSRGFYVQEAAKKGYQVHGVLFPVTLADVIARQTTRPDKNVPIEAVVRQYNSIQLPNYGEFDYIVSVADNLPKA